MGDKRSNNTRATTPTVISIRRAISNYYKKLASGEYDKDKSFINIENGGYLLYAKYRTMDNMEYNAATFMAMKGYPMIMTPEGKEGYELMIDAKGHSRYGDGRIGLTIHSQVMNNAVQKLQVKQLQGSLLRMALIMLGRKRLDCSNIRLQQLVHKS